MIAAERRGDTVEQLIERIVRATGDQEATLSAIGQTELIHGLHRAQTQEIRQRRESFLNELLTDSLEIRCPRILMWTLIPTPQHPHFHKLSDGNASRPDGSK
jgi:hypothetical protein